jgi:hypothetical protein
MRTLALTLCLTATLAGCAASRPDAKTTTPASDGQATPSQGRDGKPERPRLGPPPADLAPAVEDAIRIGRRLYEEDHAAWRATDAVLASRPKDPRVRGFVTDRLADDRVRVTFHDRANSLFEVVEAGGKPVVSAIDPPQPLDAGRLARVRALDSVSSMALDPVAPLYNPVVLATPGNDPKLVVYLLVATKDVNEIPLSGHHRIVVSGDGMRVLGALPTSKSVLITNLRDAPGKVEALTLAHVTTDAPLETHVWTSLTYGYPFVVATRRGIFVIEGTKIRYRPLENQ